ncbi:hypothetical protein AB4170_21400 [Vibrio splendidus]
MEHERTFDTEYRGYEIAPNRTGIPTQWLDDLIEVCRKSRVNHQKTTAVMFRVRYPFQAIFKDGQDVFPVFVKYLKSEIARHTSSRRRIFPSANEKKSSNLCRFVYLLEETIVPARYTGVSNRYKKKEYSEYLTAVLLVDGDRFFIEVGGKNRLLAQLIVDAWEDTLYKFKASVAKYDIELMGWYELDDDGYLDETDRLFEDFSDAFSQECDETKRTQLFGVSNR